MKTFAVAALLQCLSFPLYAAPAAKPQGPCMNYAKAAAIRAYKAEMGTVQGSEGIQYAAALKDQHGYISTYIVSVADNNEDGESWAIDYEVVTQLQGSTCKVLRTKKLPEER